MIFGDILERSNLTFPCIHKLWPTSIYDARLQLSIDVKMFSRVENIGFHNNIPIQYSETTIGQIFTHYYSNHEIVKKTSAHYFLVIDILDTICCIAPINRGYKSIPTKLDTFVFVELRLYEPYKTIIFCYTPNMVTFTWQKPPKKKPPYNIVNGQWPILVKFGGQTQCCHTLRYQL